MKFDIILVSWNRLSYLQKTVASLIASGAWAAAQRVIIVDNGSTEIGLHVFLEDLRYVHGAFLVCLPHNRGWGQAVNEALGLSRAPFLFICNNDVEFSHEFHKKIEAVFEHQFNIGILGIWRHTSHGFTKNGVMNGWFREMDDVPAIGWMLDKAAMERVGMLPEKGPCLTKGGNGEDSDYVQRMKAAGYLVGVPAEDIGTHMDGY